jgi:polyisoprenoid-binding protein YceI
MNKNLLLSAILILGFGRIVLAAPMIKTMPTSSHLEFSVVGKPAMIRIKGEGMGVTGKSEIVDHNLTGEFRYSLKELTTGIELRDRHMKEKYLEVEKFPEAIVKIEKMELQDISKAQDFKFDGKLTLHGVTKSVSGIGSFDGLGQDKRTKAEFKIRLSDFAINIPSYVGITVAEDVHIKMELTLNKE